MGGLSIEGIDKVSAPSNGLYVAGKVGIGSSTPAASLQVTNTAANATTTVEIGKSGQNKGSCLKLYRSDGSAIYASVSASATTFTLSTTACATVTGF
jgi:riboflavin synthase alpha subunit